MSTDTLPLAYANSLIFELEKAFYDERGKGARFRTTLVGQQYFQEKCAPCLLSDKIEDIADAVKQALLSDTLAEDFAVKVEDRLLRVHVEGCAHRSVEMRMLAHGVQPFTCMPANILAMALESRLNKPVELAEIKLEGCGCDLLLVLFDKRPELVGGRGAGAE
jgi:hypothetical protein